MVIHLYSKLNVLSNCSTNYVTLYLKQKNEIKLKIFEMLPFIKAIDVLWNDSIKLAQPFYFLCPFFANYNLFM